MSPSASVLALLAVMAMLATACTLPNHEVWNDVDYGVPQRTEGPFAY